MMRSTLIFFLLFAVAAVSRPAFAQASVEKDKESEKAKDKKQKADPAKKPTPEKPTPEKRVYTNDDLKNAKGERVLFLGKEAIAPPLSDTANQPGPDQIWRARAREARKAIADAELRVKELEARLAGLRNDMNPNDGARDPSRMQSREAEQAKVMGELESARAAVAPARKALEDLEEEARRQSIPPGWLREP